MLAEARVAKDSDGKSYTHFCCSWKVTFLLSLPPPSGMNNRTLLWTELSRDDDTICRDDNRCRRRPSSLKTPNVSDIDIPDKIEF